MEKQDNLFLLELLELVEEVLEPHKEAETKEAWSIIKDTINDLSSAPTSLDEFKEKMINEEDPNSWWVCTDEDVFPDEFLGDEARDGEQVKPKSLLDWFKSLFKFPYD